MGFELLSETDVGLAVEHWRAASAEFAALLARYGQPAAALRHFGLIHWQAGRHGDAVDLLTAALSLAPDDAAIWNDLAGAYEGFQRSDRAEFCLRQALMRKPEQSRSWLMLAGILARRGEAEDAGAAYRAAIASEPTSADAHFGLGMLHFDRRKLGEAIACLGDALLHAPDHLLARTCLGHVLYSMGDFETAAKAFAAVAERSVPDRDTHLKHARARTFLMMIEGQTEAALAAYPGFAGPDAEDIDTILRDAFGLLSAFGFKTAAIDVGRIRLRRNPADPIQRYLQGAVEARPFKHAPVDYLEAYFDRFAPEFDRKLVEILRYRVPEHLSGLVARHRGGFADILDLGCGTGLAAEHLASLGGRLTGLDVSGRMIDQARGRELYGELIKSEAVLYLAAQPARFDLVFAADLLVYLGDLAPLFDAMAEALVSGGIAAFSIETAVSAEFSLLSSGRFAHARAYIQRLAARAFDPLEDAQTIIRLEANQPVDGRLFVFRRR